MPKYSLQNWAIILVMQLIQGHILAFQKYNK